MDILPPNDTDSIRVAVLGDELTKAIEAYANAPGSQTLSDFSAALVGRCASMAAAAVNPLHTRIEALETARDDRA